MQHMDHAEFERWLDLQLDGVELEAEARVALARHLAACAACQALRRDLGGLRARLERDRVAVRSGFRARVMAALPAADWESRPARAWKAPALLAAGLLAVAALLAGGTAAAPGAALGTAAALVDLVVASALAGSGLLAASWRGLGMAIADRVLGSPGSLLAFAVGVLCLNLLFFRLLRRRPRPASAPADAAPRSTPGSR
jgi:anti-sigma factor RsiW